MSILLFSSALVLLLLEGWLIGGLFTRDRWLRAPLALPLAALSNVLLSFILTLLRVPLRSLWITLAHAGVMAGMYMFRRSLFPVPRSDNEPTGNESAVSRTICGLHHRILIGGCLFILLSVFAYSFVHAVLLPTFQYDAATNWIGRSKVSFLEERIVFDNTPPHELILKPQYPFLIHALHITANLGRREWSDRAANVMAFLLSWSLLAGIGILVTRLRGRAAGLLAVTLLLCVPLFAFHLGEGYVDHTLALFACLSLLTLAMHRTARGSAWLMLSGLLAAGAVWTKAEGLFFVFLPWLCVVGWMCVRGDRRELLRALFPGVLCALLWPLFAFVSGLSLTPHGGTDLQFGFQPSAVRGVIDGLFVSGSFGVLWWFLPGAILLLVLRARREHAIRRTMLPLLFFGAFAFLIVLTVYTFTPNVQYLENAQSFDRQMLTPAAMLLLSCLMLF